MVAQAPPAQPVASPTVDVPDAGVIEEARGRQCRQRGLMAAGITAAVAGIALAVAWGGGKDGATGKRALGHPPSGGRTVAGLNGGSRSSRLLSSVGVSLAVPNDWFGRSQGLPIGPTVRAAWLQVTNLPTRRWVHGVDPIDAMGANDVVVTVSADGPYQGIVQHNRIRLRMVASEIVPAWRTPRRDLVLQSMVILDGGLLSIDADFGSRNAASRLLPLVNRVLSTLRVRPVGYRG